MKKVWVILTCMICVIIIMAGNLHWQIKTGSKGAQQVLKLVDSSKEQTESEDAPIKEEPNASKNLPKELAAKIKAAQEGGEPVKFVMYGSETTSSEPNAWPILLQNKLNEAYGEQVFEIVILSEIDKTSREVINEGLYKKIIEQNPDLVLLEPFLLKDNGEIGILNTLLNVETMVADIKKQNPEATIMLQPPHPLFGAKFYPKEVDEFKKFAEEKEYLYLDHWINWPKGDDEKLNDYLTEDKKPNDQGNKAWAEYLIGYFVAEK
ncbi:SGNH/GDSL hydrolase family protein [Bacillus sp. PAMC26568]|nr:SGNH/GDSL hydrolase family protein [Bacillus sp. PAMC26568]